MRSFKSIYLAILLVTFVLLVCACSNSKDSNDKSLENQIPKLTVKIGEKDLSSDVISIRIKEVNKESTEVFQNIIKSNDIVYVELGSTIKLELDNKDSANYKLLDYVLKEDGTLKFQKSTIKETEGKFDEGINIFSIDKNEAINLSSSSKNFEVGQIIRGFRIIYNYKSVMYEYDFVIRTDAKEK